MELTFPLIVQTLLPAFLTGVFLLAEKKDARWGAFPRWARQLVIGVAFGAAAVFATETGSPVVDGDAVANVRDAAPVVAGLAFGCPAGIVAGAIGAAERWLCVLWGGGETTRFACSMATLVSGLVAGLMRKLVFEDKRPVLGYAVGIGVSVETFHMLLILITGLDSTMSAFAYVQACSFSMIVLNAVACGLAFVGQSFIDRASLFARPPYLINDLATRLFGILVLALVTILIFTLAITDSLSYQQVNRLLVGDAEDIAEIAGRIGWDDMLDSDYAWRVQTSGSVIVYDKDTHKILTPAFRGRYIEDIIQRLPSELTYDVCDYVDVNGIPSYAIRHYFAEGGGHEALLYLPEEEADAVPELMVYLIIDMDILVLAVLFIVLFQLLRRRVINNLQLVEGSLDDVAHGNLDTSIDVRTHQEFEHLSGNINTTIAALKGYIEEAEHRHDAELALARQIQHSALPSVFPPYPDRLDFDLYASMRAAREVGGDFYDFFMLNNHTLVFLVADVSGKGVPAALFMMKAKTEIHSLMVSRMEVDEAFTEANRVLCEANESGMFVTAWLGKLDLSTGELAFANAGHNPPLLRRANGAYEYLRVERPNFFLAGMEGIRYRRNLVTLGPGDKLFLYTDGVTEACDESEALFGEKRLLATLNGLGEKEGPRQTCEAVAAAVAAYAGGAEQSDDITMLSVSIMALRGRDRVITDAQLDSVEIVGKFFDERLPRLGAGARSASRVRVVADEAYSNICRYGKASRAVVSIIRRGADLLVEFVDDGVEFDPTAAPDADTTLPASEREIGGLGIHMMRRMSRSMEYRRVDGLNILTVVFAVE